MGTIIGEGITFDDVLLVPAYSKVIPNQVYSNRASHGNRYGETGWYWYYS